MLWYASEWFGACCATLVLGLVVILIELVMISTGSVMVMVMVMVMWWMLSTAIRSCCWSMVLLMGCGQLEIEKVFELEVRNEARAAEAVLVSCNSPDPGVLRIASLLLLHHSLCG
jgi:hypothetical protein